MHRVTPLGSAFRAYTSGGARSTVSSIDDKKLMQEMGGGMMKGESRSKIEAPHSYGFTSVPHDPDKDKDGKETGGPETFVSYMGGNRSFPVAGPIDDRRHRLKGLEKGDVALFRGKDDGQQFHMNGIGGFWSANNDKKVRMQLVQKKDQQQQSGGGGGPQTMAAGGGGGGEADGGKQKPTGQEAVYKNESSQYLEVNPDATESVNKHHKIMLDDKETAVEVHSDKNVYLGGLKGSGTFSKVLTVDGPSKNVYARVG